MATPQAATDYIKRQALFFYVARGEADACGEGCDTWIAAQGAFDQNAAPRFRRFLKTIGRYDLPVFFNSPGGIAESAMDLGRVLREKKMTAAVGKTMPRDCLSNGLLGKDCDLRAAPGKALASTLTEDRSLCASACVFALLGATTRHVSPNAVLAVHAARPIRIYDDGRTVAGTAAGLRPMLARLRTYIGKMGVDPALVDVAESVSHDRLRALTRGEIAGLKIDTREFSETGWALRTPPSGRAHLVKVVSQAKGAGSPDYIVRSMVVACSPTPKNLLVLYTGDLDSHLSHAMGAVRLDIGSQQSSPVMLSEVRTAGGSEARSNQFSIDQLTEAGTAPHILVAEDVDRDVLRLKLSTAGLSSAIGELTKRCR